MSLLIALHVLVCTEGPEGPIFPPHFVITLHSPLQIPQYLKQLQFFSLICQRPILYRQA